MAMSELETMQRSEATLAVMQTLQPTWTWDEMDPATFAARLAAARDAASIQATQKAAYDQQRAAVDTRFADLESRKVQGIGVAGYRFRKMPEQLGMIESVGEYGDSREAILKEAEEWLAAWQRLDPVWNPTAENNTRAFQALLTDAKAQLSALTGTRADWRKAAVAHNALLAELEDLCVAWYGAATRIFAAGTPEGDLVRGQIPTFAPSTTSQPAPPSPAPNPAPNP